MDVTTVADSLRAALPARAVAGRAEHEKRYLRSGLRHIGVPLPAMRALVRDVRRAHPDASRAEVTALAEELWSEPVHEHRSLALLLLGAHVDRLTPDDVPLLESLLRECATWAHVDLLAPPVAGPLMLAHPEVLPDVRRWAADDAMWTRRGGVLSFLLPLRDAREFPRWWPEFTAVADGLLADERFFVRKAIGWVLREGTRHHPETVTAWLAARREQVSALTMREATRRLR